MKTRTKGSRYGGPTGTMTRKRQIEWSSDFDTALERFMRARFPRHNDAVPVPTHVVWSWFMEANTDPRFADVSTGTVCSALNRLGKLKHYSRIRYTPPDNGNRACSATAFYLGDPGMGHGSWHPDKYRE